MNLIAAVYTIVAFDEGNSNANPFAICCKIEIFQKHAARNFVVT